MIRHNTSFIRFGSSYSIADKTDYSLAIHDAVLLPKIIINFPSHIEDLVIDKPNVFNMTLDRIHSRISNEYANIYFVTPRFIGNSERFAIVAFLKLGNNIPIEEQNIFFEFASKMIELLQIKLSKKTVISRISAVYSFLPMIPEPTWKDKVKSIIKRVFTTDFTELPQPRPSKNLYYPDMKNINFDILVRHAYNQLLNQLSSTDSMKLTSINGFMIFKVIDINNRVENEAQIIVED